MLQDDSAAGIESYSFEKRLMELPSHRALQDFLDRHVPDGENDLAFANGVINDLVEMARFEYSASEIIDAIQDRGLILDSAPKTGRMLSLVMDFLNDVPIWGNNGRSPAALYAREMGAGGMGTGGGKGGKRVFYDESSKPRKVGRNEPCPCGSGKKYKRCCGR